MAEALKSIRLSNTGKQTEGIQIEKSTDEHTSAGNGLATDQAVMLQKRLEVENLRRQYALEQELSKCYQQQLPASRRSAPPGFGRQFCPIQPTHPVETAYDQPLHPGQGPSSGPANPWQKYQRDYEQVMRTQFLKNITKGPRLDFPKFDGGNPIEWIRQCEKCFQMSATPDDYKFSLAQLYIVGKADVWLRRSKILQNHPTWPKFCEMLIQRFSSHSSYQLVKTFNNLRQNNASVTEYADQFEELMATISEENPELSEGWFVRCFVNGLRDGIKYQLRPLRPQSLTEAFWLAKDMESNNQPKRAFQNPYVPPFQRFQHLPAPPPVKPLPAPPVPHKLEYPQPTNITQQRIRKPGDCWRCGDKWFHGHKCAKIPALHLLQEGTSAQQEEEEVTAEQQQAMEEAMQHQDTQLMSITGQALDATLPTNTPCVLISIGGKRTVALLDSGSTSTFMDQSFAIKANCQLLLQQFK
jgi:hypothetical protein